MTSSQHSLFDEGDNGSPAEAVPPDSPPENDSAEDLPDDPNKRLGVVIRKIAGQMRPKGSMSTGDQAELRRISPKEPYTPKLWKLLFMYDLQNDWLGIGQDAYERRMGTLLMGMAQCSGDHDDNTSLGHALAEAGWSELRFVRLMEARGETLEVLIRRLAQYLSSKGQSANWVDVAWLLLSQDLDFAEKTRLRIARSYYGTLYQKEKAE